jgi:hypothetical protein
MINNWLIIDLISIISLISPFDPSTPTGFGFLFVNVIRKSIGISNSVGFKNQT